MLEPWCKACGTYDMRSASPLGAASVGASLAPSTTSICSGLVRVTASLQNASYPHSTIVDLDSVQLLGRLRSGSWAAEDDLCNTTAASLRSIGEKHFLDMTDSLAKVVLNQSNVSSIWRRNKVSRAMKRCSNIFSNSNIVSISSSYTPRTEAVSRAQG